MTSLTSVSMCNILTAKSTPPPKHKSTEKIVRIFLPSFLTNRGPMNHGIKPRISATPLKRNKAKSLVPRISIVVVAASDRLQIALVLFGSRYKS